MVESSKLKRTPLYESHLECGGKIVPFAGWEMPVQYQAGVVEEHLRVREAVGLFDVSHMGEIDVKGSGAISFLEYVTCNAVSSMKDGQARYNALPNPEGGIIDDIIVYRRNSEDFLLCVNASNADIDFQWLKEHEKSDVSVENVSQQYGQIAVQGPKAFAVLEKIFSKNIGDHIKSFRFYTDTFEGQEVTVARTGYTGEKGVEIFVAPEKTAALWSALLENGKDEDVLPCGLGARDSLRLEACYPLHGHELSTEISAIESGLGWIVKPDKKGDFIGRAVLEKQKLEGSPRKLVGFFVEDKGLVREGAEVFSSEGKPVGFVTSGTKTPTVGKKVGKALGLALVESGVAELGTELFGEVRGRKLKISVVDTPFYRQPD